jgi:hypothetical protein
MATTIAARPSIRHPRRTAVAVALAGALTVGVGVVGLTSTDHSAGRRDASAPRLTATDAQAVWNWLSTLPATGRDAIVAGLAPPVRAQLRAIGDDIAVAAEHH